MVISALIKIIKIPNDAIVQDRLPFRQVKWSLVSLSRHLLIGESNLAIFIVQVDYLTSYTQTMDDMDTTIHLWIEADIKTLKQNIRRGE